MKTTWHFLTELDYLWTRVLRAKYVKNESGMITLTPTPVRSNLWKGMVDVWTKVKDDLM